MKQQTPLEKDVQIIAKALNELTAIVNERKKELELLNIEIVNKRNELVDINSKYQPLIQALNKRIDELSAERDSITMVIKEREVASLDKINELKKRESDIQSHIDSLIESRSFIESDIEKKKDVSNGLESTIRVLSETVECLDKREKTLKKSNADLESQQNTLLKKNLDLNESIDTMEDIVSEIEMREDSLLKKDIELNDRERDIIVMEKRLRPEYIKVFKSFNNIKDN